MKKRLWIGSLLAGLLAVASLGAPALAAADPKLNVSVSLEQPSPDRCQFPMEVKANFWQRSEGFDELKVVFSWYNLAGTYREWTDNQPYVPNAHRATWRPLGDSGGPFYQGNVDQDLVISYRVEALLDDVVKATQGGSFLCVVRIS